jgi:type IV pilus assembly protein PilV
MRSDRSDNRRVSKRHRERLDSGWLVFADIAGTAGVIDVGDEILQRFDATPPAGVTVLTNNRPVVSFGATGLPPTGAVDTTFTIKHSACTGNNLRTVKITATGRLHTNKASVPMIATHALRARQAQTGMTLVEVLVTLVLISVGLLGVAALQLTTLKNTQESYVRSQAALLAADMLDRMRSQPDGLQRRQLRHGRTMRRASIRRVPPALSLPTDVAAWQASINRLLPGSDSDAAGRIVRNGRVVTITIRWREREEQAAARTYDPANLPTFQTRSEI